MLSESGSGTPNESATLIVSGAGPAGEDAPTRTGSVDRFLLVEELGRGGMGVIYRAYDPKLRREVALKQLKARFAGRAGEKARRRLLREAQSVAALAHPNVIAVHDVIDFDGELFVALEYVEGTDLGEWAKGDRTTRERLAVLRAAGAGLQAAHAAGLVHRDFKSANVLVGGDGRVRVTDFGLAVRDRELTTSDGEAPDEEDEGRTQHGLVMGTPGYMAPEQHEGHAATAASDQYAFCVTAYEILFGVRPFSRTAERSILDIKCDMVLTPPVADRKVPGAVRRAILRGLSVEAEHRFGSMEELLAHFEPRRRRPVAVGLGAAAVVSLAAFQVMSPGNPCAEVSPPDAWGAEQRAAVEAGLAEHDLDAEVVSSVVGELDRYAQDWQQTGKQACEAALVRHEQSETLYDRARLCLDRRIDHLRAAVSTLSDASAGAARNAHRVVEGMPPSQSCADAAYLLAEVAPPDDPAVAQEARLLDAEGAALTAQVRAGEYVDTIPKFRALVERAQATEYLPVVGRAMSGLSNALETGGQYDEAERVGREAYDLLVAAGDDMRAIRQAVTLVYVMGDRSGRPTEGMEWAEHARALARRSDAARRVHAEIDAARASMLHTAGRLDESLELFEKAIAELEALVDEGDPLALGKLTIAKMNVGAVLRDHRRIADAREVYEWVEATVGRERGHGHPMYALAAVNLAIVTAELDGAEAALKSFEDAAALARRILGPEHPNAIIVEANLGLVLIEVGRVEEGEKHLTELAADADLAKAPAPLVATIYVNLARSKILAGDLETARTYLDAANEAFVGREEVPWDAVAYGIAVRTELEERSGNHEAVVELSKPLLDEIRPLGTNTPPKGLDVAVRVADALRILGRLDEARSLSDELVAAVKARKNDRPLIQLLSYFLRARLSAGTADGEIARAELVAARAAFEAKDDNDETLARQVDAWLK